VAEPVAEKGCSPRPGHVARWVPWIAGVGLLAGVVYLAVHFSEAEEFARLGETAKPRWLLVAFVLQAATYLAQGEVFCRVGRVGGSHVRRWTAYRLSLAKLFIDQAIPSAGLSGTVLIADSLERDGMPRPVVAAAIAVDSASYYVAYVLSLVAAIVFLGVNREESEVILLASAGFCLFAIVFAVTVLLLAGRTRKLPPVIARLRPLKVALGYLAEADRELVWNARLLAETTVYQLVIVLCDATTLWVLIESLGRRASIGGVFGSFMVSSLLRTVGIVPGGLGTFEAASVLTLKAARISLRIALSATLLFRGLSFWLPMLPGFWFSRHMGATRQRVTER
jgi:uncharacterized protein (TIRG00374 family)